MQDNDIQTEQEAQIERVPFYTKRQTINLPPINAEPKYRVSLMMGWFLLMFTLIVDLLELLLSYTGVGILIATLEAFAAGFILWLWFKLLDVNYTSNTKSFVTSITMYVTELIPGLDLIPFWFAWTVGMMLIITLSRMEDRGEEPTITGALGRIFTFAGGPITAIARYPFQKYRDRKRINRTRRELEQERLELLENPDNEEEIVKKYGRRAEKFKRRDMGIIGRTENRFFKVGNDGVSLREGRSLDEAKQSFGKLAERQSGAVKKIGNSKGNVLNLKK